ncbi:hypothetical protein BpOF4_04440 [Alkalihalophilus pseudofirmus OF4]|uniref:Uncharacterized protein n=1 Tax=Alkalihalophilus pseudofirmus (strain ATCC BAA-2126 / JCM 17055 / OF4) TaxID=398511 RepID=D3FXW5_ALKPO|nr:hypothetical protein BpOF4_04440 [Alkalihalophilus pseudofirmus OF4]
MSFIYVIGFIVMLAYLYFTVQIGGLFLYLLKNEIRKEEIK